MDSGDIRTHFATMSDVSAVSRRRFLGSVAAAVSAPTIIPASALGRGGRPAPSGRVNVACIGMGTVATTTSPAFLNEKRVQVVSIADVNKESGHYW